MSSGHIIPCGKPGKFSTVVVVVSCQPAATPHARSPSNIKGCKLALAAYIAAVCHAGHDQMMMRLWVVIGF